MAAKTKNKLSKFEWVKKNIVIVPVVAAILAGTFTSVRYVLSLTDTIEANKQTIINLQRELTVQEDKLTEASILASELVSLSNILGILLDDPKNYFTSGIDLSNQDIEAAIEVRNKARKDKDFELSDKIRDDLLKKGITLEDKGTKTIWKKS